HLTNAYIELAEDLLGTIERGWFRDPVETRECSKRDFAAASFLNCRARLDIQPTGADANEIFSFRRARDACPCQLIRPKFRKKSGSASSKNDARGKSGAVSPIFRRTADRSWHRAHGL